MRSSGRVALLVGKKGSRPWRVVALALAIAAAPVGYVASTTKSGQQFVASALAAPMAILEGRSPGARGAGALAQSKPSRPLVTASVSDLVPAPTERVLSGVRNRPGAGPAAQPGVPVVSLAPVGGPEALPPGGGLGSPGIGGLGAGSGVGGGGFGGAPGGGVGGGIGGGGGGGGPGTAPPTGGSSGGQVPVVAVPEPETWVMMLTGFFAIGSAMRSRRRRSFVNSAKPTT